MRFMILLIAALINASINTSTLAAPSPPQVNLIADSELSSTKTKAASPKISTKKKIALGVAFVGTVGVLATLYYQLRSPQSIGPSSKEDPVSKVVASPLELLTQVGIKNPNREGEVLSSVREIASSDLIPEDGQEAAPVVKNWLKQMEALACLNLAHIVDDQQYVVLKRCQPLLTEIIYKNSSGLELEQKLIEVTGELFWDYFRQLADGKYYKTAPQSSILAHPYSIFIFHENLQNNMNICRVMKKQAALYPENNIRSYLDLETTLKYLPKYRDGKEIEILSQPFQKTTIEFKLLKQLIDIVELRSSWINKNFLEMITQSEKAKKVLEEYLIKVQGIIPMALQNLAGTHTHDLKTPVEELDQLYKKGFPVISPYFHSQVRSLCHESSKLGERAFPYMISSDPVFGRLETPLLAQYALSSSYSFGVQLDAILDHSYLWVTNTNPTPIGTLKFDQKKHETEENLSKGQAALEANAMMYLLAVRNMYIKNYGVPENQLKDEMTIYKALISPKSKEILQALAEQSKSENKG